MNRGQAAVMAACPFLRDIHVGMPARDLRPLHRPNSLQIPQA